ncbi:MAG: hypothetical protein JWQ96_1239 [Segetibacter sp.]|nr:hypothetical protein [Segetibacter sp.]
MTFAFVLCFYKPRFILLLQSTTITKMTRKAKSKEVRNAGLMKIISEGKAEASNTVQVSDTTKADKN